ncbi:MAG: DUF4080 domain-containing protein [Gammaproteobacteria bacterium]|nr:DUF4080 domain-containing protein [Gammaproteobacteria bacterium]
MLSAEQKDIVLCTINARYIHSAFGLRYLQANLGELQSSSVIKEFTLESRVEDMAEQILMHAPRIIGLGIYVWNCELSEKLVALLKQAALDVQIVLGGPEVSYEYESQPMVALADYLITGWGEISFATLCQSLLRGETVADTMLAGEQGALRDLEMPYSLYNEQDIKHRIIYVEASRGCPFKCEFCLSALDKTAWPFDLDRFLEEMDLLYQRGARHFKFVDRTFNLKVKSSLRILDFFLARLDADLFLHFEVIPDHLPPLLQEKIAQFPPGTLQFEIGIQSFNETVQQNISRRQNNEAAEQNIGWILEHSNAHVHTDLIFGLPGEDMSSFAASFDRLCALGPHEIQVGILKRLKGSPIIRHTDTFQLRFNPNPPFNVISTDRVTFRETQAMQRFARFWDLIGNSGHFKHSLPQILGASPFSNFSGLAARLYESSGQTHKISLLRLYDLVYEAAIHLSLAPADTLQVCLANDVEVSGLKSKPRFLLGARAVSSATRRKTANQRQTRHLQ